MGEIVVRPAVLGDVAGMAAVHVRAWQQTYRGLVADARLDALDAVTRRQQMWTRVLTTGFEGTSAVAVAESGGEIVGIASAGTPRDADADWPIEVFVLYLLADHHGSGAGSELLAAVIGDRPASLWVADPNPRAQAFYRKAGFAPDGVEKDDGIPEIRMLRRQQASTRFE